MNSISHRVQRLAKAFNVPTPPEKDGLLGVLTMLSDGTDFQRILFILLMGVARSENPKYFPVSAEMFKAVLGIVEKRRLERWPDKQPLEYSDDLYIGFLFYMQTLKIFKLVEPKECVFMVNNADLLAELHLTGFDAEAAIARRKLN